MEVLAYTFLCYKCNILVELFNTKNLYLGTLTNSEDLNEMPLKQAI